MQMASSARSTGRLFSSAVEWATTVLIPNSLAARIILKAISPRLAMRTFFIAAGSGRGAARTPRVPRFSPGSS